MTKKVMFIAVLFQCSFASTVSLQQILDSYNTNSPINKAIKHGTLSRDAGGKSEVYEPLQLFGSVAQANPAEGKREEEFSVGVSKKIYLNNIKEKELEIINLKNNATLLEEEKSLLSIENQIKNMYHQHCIEKKIYRTMKQEYNEFVKLYQKKQKAYKLHEISKTELIQLEMEMKNLFSILNQTETEQMVSRKNILRLTTLNDKNGKHLKCTDMYPVKKVISHHDKKFKYTKEAHQKKIQSFQKQILRHSNSLDSIELSVQYDKEIDTHRYSLGFSIPLNFTSKKSELKRLEALHKSSELQYRYEHDMQYRKQELFILENKLKTKVQMLQTIASSLKRYRDVLLPLMHKGYEAGETSLIEFLLTKQKYRELQQNYHQHQKSYYHTLFKLYTLIEKKDKQ